MKLFLNFAAYLFTAGFFGHDLHYTLKYFGVSYTSIFFLMGLFWFHALILWVESGRGIIDSPAAHRTIFWMRMILLGLSIMVVLKETIPWRHWDQVDLACLAECLISIMMVIFPDKVFWLMFRLKSKRRIRRAKAINTDNA